MHCKKALALLSLLLVLALAATALAAPEETAQPSEAANRSASSGLETYLSRGILSIDGAYTQDGMNAPYKEGYSPAVSDGTLEVVLPLLASSEIDGEILYCDLDLGDAETSPFKYTNYDSIPVGLRYGDPDSESYNPSLYVADFKLPLSEHRKNGVYNLGVAIRYRASGESATQRFHISFNVTDGEAPEPSAEPTEPSSGDDGNGGNHGGGTSGGNDWGDDGGGDWGSGGGGGDYPTGGGDSPGGGDTSGGGAGAQPTTASEPKVILEHYVAEPSPCDAGNAFTVTCTLRNTSKSSGVKNMTVTYKSQTTDLIPEGTSTSYIEAIKKNSTAQFAFSMKVAETATSGPQKIDVSLAYEGAEGTQYTAADEITVIVQQRIRLEWDQPNFPTSVFLGDTVNTTLNLYNKGKGTLYNVTVTLEVPGLTPESSAFLGNMESGGSKSADIYASVTGLQEESFVEEMEPAQPEEPSGAADDTSNGGSLGETVVEGIIGGADAPTSLVLDGTSLDMPMMAVDAADVTIVGQEGTEMIGEEETTGGGETQGNFVISYENEFGEVFERNVPVSTFIEAIPVDNGMYPEEPTDVEEPESTGFPWWGWALIGGGGAAAGGLVYRSRKKKRAAMLAEDAEVDDDDIY